MAEDAQILRLIGLIYDAVIEPARWHAALDAIRAHFRFYNAILGVNQWPSGDGILYVAVNVTPEQEAIALKYMTHMPDLWGGVERAYNMPLEEPMLQSRATDPATWMDNPYFSHFGAPQDLVDVIGVALVRDSRTIATLGMARHRSAPELTEAQMDDLRKITPHLARAVAIGRILDVAMVKAESFSAALDASSSAVVLVDDSGAVVHANKVAEVMLAAGDPLRVRDGRVMLTTEVVSGQLEAALKGVTNEATLGRRGMAIPTRRRDGTPLVARILPLAHRSVRGGTIRAATAAIFISGPTAEPEAPSDALHLLFDLTPAEARVFTLAATGRPNKEIAQAIGVAPSTIKTHLQRIFEKTGSRKRADLVRLSHEVSGSD